jgi:hypothetical protein
MSLLPSVPLHPHFNVVSTITFDPPSVQCRFYHQFRSLIRTISFAPTSLVFPYTLPQPHFQCRSAISVAPTSSVFTSTIDLNFFSTKLHVDSTISLAPTISFAPTSSVFTSTIGLNYVSMQLSMSVSIPFQHTFQRRYHLNLSQLPLHRVQPPPSPLWAQPAFVEPVPYFFRFL